jgi:hypothetical protein
LERALAASSGGGCFICPESRAALQLENIALRHQIGVLQRSANSTQS